MNHQEHLLSGVSQLGLSVSANKLSVKGWSGQGGEQSVTEIFLWPAHDRKSIVNKLVDWTDPATSLDQAHFKQENQEPENRKVSEQFSGRLELKHGFVIGEVDVVNVGNCVDRPQIKPLDIISGDN